MAEISGTLGIGFRGRLGGRELFKLIPGFGSAVAALFAAASTYALGCTLCAYFSFVRERRRARSGRPAETVRSGVRGGRTRLRAYLHHLGSRTEGDS